MEKSPTTKQKDAIERSLAKVVSIVGSIATTMPVRIFQSDLANTRQPVAFTNSEGLYLASEVVDLDTANIHVYWFHEFMHHVVGDDELGLAHQLRNIAEDYFINSFMLKLFGFDVKKVRYPGIRSSTLKDKSVKEIADYLTSKHKTHIKGAGCGCNGIAHPQILKAARLFRRKYKDYIVHPDRNLFYMDRVDEEIFYAKLPQVRKALHTKELPYVNLDMTLEGLWAGLYKDTALANCISQDRLTPAEQLVYAFPYDRFRGLSVHNADVSIMAATLFINHCNMDKLYIATRVEKIKRRIARYTKLMNMFPAERRKKGCKHTKTKLRSLIEKNKEQLRYWATTHPLNHLITNHRIQHNGKAIAKRRVSMTTLKTYVPASKQRIQVMLPGLVRNETYSRVQSIARRSEHQLELLLDLMERFKAHFQDLLEKDQNETVDTAQTPNAPIDESEIPLEEDDDTGKAKGKRKKPQPLPDDADEGIVPEEKKGKSKKDAPPAPGAGNGQGSRSKLDVMSFVLEHMDLLSRILTNMEEILTQLEKRPSKRQAEEGLDTNFALGRTLSKVVPSDLALLGNKQAKMAFMIKYGSYSLMQVNPAQARRSPVVIAVDSSGSMKGERYEIAAGFALAMIKMLAKEGRGCGLLTFSDGVGDECVVGSNGSMNLLQMVKVLINPYIGGTNFDKPMHRSYDIKQEQSWKNLTTIMATDGDCGFHNAQSVRDRMSQTDRAVAIIAKGRYDNLDGVFERVYNADRDGLTLSLVKAGQSIL